MTRYVKIDEIFDGDGLNTESQQRTGSKRVVWAVVAAAIVLGLTAVAPSFLAGIEKTMVWGGGAALAALVGIITYVVTGRSSEKPAKAAAPPPAFAQEAESDSISSDDSMDESGIPEFEDTIPFHRGGAGGQKPFKMTEASELNAYLVVISGPDKGRRFGLRPVSRIGRDLRLDIRPHDPEISRHHAVLTFDGRGFFAEDLGSTNGTFVNEERLVGKRRVHHGDLVRCGTSSMRFEYAGEAAA